MGFLKRLKYLLMILGLSAFFILLLKLHFTSDFQSGPVRRMKLLTSGHYNFNELKRFSEESNDKFNSSILVDSPTELSDIYISVKTSEQYHFTRLAVIIQTWFTLARNETFFFTEVDDANLSKITGGHMVNTKCPSGHDRLALCCKLSAEFDGYISSKKRWWCHFDDDIYVNVPNLVRLLRSYSHLEDWYLGNPSLPFAELKNFKTKEVITTFRFATGCAYCISRRLALKIVPYISNGRLTAICKNIHKPDDVAIGFIITHLLQIELTEVAGFRYHMERMRQIYDLRNQISLSYKRKNVVKVNGISKGKDPTRFRSLHCYLFPSARNCPWVRNFH